MHKQGSLKIVAKIILIILFLSLLIITATMGQVIKNDYLNQLYLSIFILILFALLLGAYEATIVVFGYLALGALGMPILTDGQSDIFVFISPIGGYLLGLIPCVMICGLIGGIPVQKPIIQIFKVCLLGNSIQLLMGCFLLYTMNGKLSLANALATGFSAYIPQMVLTCALATFCYKLIAQSSISQKWIKVSER